MGITTSGIPHPFGGALVLAWWFEHARGTIDCDIFIEPGKVLRVFDVLPNAITFDDSSAVSAIRSGQVRLWWDTTPVDVVLDTEPFHAHIATRVRHKALRSRGLQFLPCCDLSVCNAVFNRTRDRP